MTMFRLRPQIALLRAARSSDEVHKRLDATAQRIVALTAPEEQYLRFHELRLPALVDDMKQKAAGCGLILRKHRSAAPCSSVGMLQA